MNQVFACSICVCAGFAALASKSAAQPTSEELQSAGWWLDRAVDFADQVPAGADRSEAHYQLTYALARDGDFDRALAAAANVAEPQIQVYSYGYIAKMAYPKGEESVLAAALEAARRVAIPAEVGQTNAYMLRLYFELSRSDDALGFARELPHQFQKLNAFTNVATELGKLGRVEEAMQVVRQHQPANWLDAGRSAVAQGSAEGGHFDQAISLAAQIEQTNHRDNANDRIADRLARSGDLDMAREVAGRVTDERRRDARMAQILAASVGADREARSVAVAFEQAETREEKTSLGLLRFGELVEAQKVAEAEALIESLATVVEQSPQEPQVSKFGSFDDSLMIATIRAGYLETARLLAEAGDQGASQERIEKAVVALKGVESPGLGKMMLYRKAIGQLSALGAISAAQELIDQQDTPYTQATSSADVAAALIRDGKIDEGLKLARESVADRSMGSGTRRVAIALLQTERFDQLGQFMSQMPASKNEVRAFREIAQQMVEQERSQQLHELIDQLPSAAARAQTCLGAHDALTQ